MRNANTILLRQKERDHMADIGANGKIISKCGLDSTGST
jgi:hypothetical protein